MLQIHSGLLWWFWLSSESFFILKFPNLEFTIIWPCDHINRKALKLLVECHCVMLACSAWANRSLLQLCHPSVWIKLSSSELTSFRKDLRRQKFGGWYFVLLLKDKLFSWNSQFRFFMLLCFHLDSFKLMLSKHNQGNIARLKQSLFHGSPLLIAKCTLQ